MPFLEKAPLPLLTWRISWAVTLCILLVGMVLFNRVERFSWIRCNQSWVRSSKSRISGSNIAWGLLAMAPCGADLQSWWSRMRGGEDPNKQILIGPRPRPRKLARTASGPCRKVDLEVEQGGARESSVPMERGNLPCSRFSPELPGPPGAGKDEGTGGQPAGSGHRLSS